MKFKKHECGIKQQYIRLAGYISVIYRRRKGLFDTDKVKSALRERAKQQKNNQLQKMSDVGIQIWAHICSNSDAFIESLPITPALVELIREKEELFKAHKNSQWVAVMKQIEAEYTDKIETLSISIMNCIYAVKKHSEKIELLKSR